MILKFKIKKDREIVSLILNVVGVGFDLVSGCSTVFTSTAEASQAIILRFNWSTKLGSYISAMNLDISMTSVLSCFSDQQLLKSVHQVQERQLHYKAQKEVSALLFCSLRRIT